MNKLKVLIIVIVLLVLANMTVMVFLSEKGKMIENESGATLVTKKSTIAKGQIITYSRDFDGTLKDTEVIKLVGISRNTYYKYKKELLQEK